MHAKSPTRYIILKLKEIKNKEKSPKKPELKQQQQQQHKATLHTEEQK